MSRSKTRSEDKIAAVEKYKRGETSQSGIAKEYGVDQKTLCAWIANYVSHGAEGFMPTPKNKGYSKELETQAVEAYLKGQGSQQDICKKYKILSCRALRDWIAVYNGHKNCVLPEARKGVTVKQKSLHFGQEDFLVFH